MRYRIALSSVGSFEVHVYLNRKWQSLQGITVDLYVLVIVFDVSSVRKSVQGQSFCLSIVCVRYSKSKRKRENCIYLNY